MENAPENDIVDDLMAYESGEMEDPNDVILFFGRLLESGMAWQLQGHYGRMATSLIDAGYLDRDGNVLMFV